MLFRSILSPVNIERYQRTRKKVDEETDLPYTENPEENQKEGVEVNVTRES